MHKIPNIVVIGGGTGTFTVLNSLCRKKVHLTALMTMVDDGGSNRILRDEFGLLPTSGIRQAMVALSSHQSLLRDLFMYRFHQGTGISGMTFGNLFLAAMADILGSQDLAIEQTSKLLHVRGKIYPISYDNVRLVATYADGTEILGEHKIDQPSHNGKLKIVQLKTIPKATISAQAKDAILAADFIILGPGDFYGNTVANLIIDGVVDAIKSSRASLVFITNLMTKYGETYDYQASDYLADLQKYLPLSRLNYMVINNDINFPRQALDKYTSEFSRPVIDDISGNAAFSDLKILRAPMVSREVIKTEAGDTVTRSMIRHDTKKLARLLMSIINDRHI